MNKQDIFDTVVRHLGKQGRPAASPTGTCAYRMDDGRKCAAGALIPDEAYVPEMEGKNVARLLLRDISSRLPEFFRTEVALISDLQSAHDVDWQEYRYGVCGQDDQCLVQSLRYIAQRHSLNADVIAEAFPKGI